MDYLSQDQMQFSLKKIKIITHGSRTGDDRLFIFTVRNNLTYMTRHNFTYDPSKTVIINIDTLYTSIKKIELQNGNNMKFEIIFSIHDSN